MHESALGKTIKNLREKSKLSVTELASNVNISKAHLSDLENGKTNNPSARLLKNIAKNLNVNVSVFMELIE